EDRLSGAVLARRVLSLGSRTRRCHLDGPGLVNRRAMMLEELGLLPRWVLRVPAERAEPAPELSPSKTRTLDRAEAIEVSCEIAGRNGAQLKAAVRECTACRLHAARTQTVFGVGDETADWMFIGEGPGAEEDARGEPFVGQAGRLLDNMLAAIGLK